MASKKKSTPSTREKRHLRRQQIIFAAIAFVLILSWVLSLIVR